jgi:GTP-binding protein YchF
MGFKCGIVGLPNVGKSTLFNALTATIAAEAANYPFCTIEPNNGIVAVPDSRLKQLADIAGSKKIIPTQIELVDIAGLVKGASQGEGLGNKFLAHIREVDAIIHVLRCFEDADITHVHGKIDPVGDAEVIETELILADLESVEKRLPALEKKAKTGDKISKEQVGMLQPILKVLHEGKPARILIKSNEDVESFKPLNLLTTKPVLYVCNVLEEEAATGNELTKQVGVRAKQEGAGYLVISSKIEAEISNLESSEEREEFLAAIGLQETGLNKIIRAGYEMLNLKSYFTVGPKETHAWTFKEGITAPQAAGIIHTDFEKGFIRAEVIAFEDYIKYNGEAGSKEVGKMRLEGKEYKVKDGDIMHFRFNV